MLGNQVGYLLLSVGRTGIKIVLCINHIGQRLGIFDNTGHIGISADVPAAVADKYADAGLLTGNIFLGRVLLMCYQSTTLIL